MKWRKVLVVFLAAILCVGMLAGCGESKETSKDKDVEIEEVDEKEEAAAAEKSEAAPEKEEKEAEPEKTPEVTEEPAEPEEEVTAESLLNDFYELSKDVKDISFDMLLALDMKLNAMGSEMAQDMKMDIHFETDKVNAYMIGSMEGNMDGETQSEEVEQYIMNEDGKTVTYSYDKASDTWSVGEGEEISISEEMIPQPDAAAFKLEEDGDQYIVSGSIEMTELIESSGETMSELFEELAGAGGMEFAGKANLEYCFDKETKALKSVKMDMASVLQETFMALFTELLSGQELGEDIDLSSMFEIAVDSFEIDLTDIAVNEGIEIVLPEEAKKEASAASSADSSSTNKGSAQAAGDFSPFSPVENDECVVTVTELDPEGDWGYTLDLTLENKSADVKYTYSVDQVFVNGLAANAYLYEEVAAGKKANAEIEIDSDTLAEYGIDDFTDIEIAIRVQNSDDWSEDPVAEETFHIYPYGEDKAEKYVRESQASDIVLVDENNAKMILTGQRTDDYGYNLDIYVENNTDKVLTIEAEDVSLNGFMADPYYYVLIYPGKCAYQTMYWSTSDLEKNKITDIEEIEAIFTGRIYGDWSSDPVFSKTVTITP